MKLLFCLLVSICVFSSCGLVATIKRNNYLSSKGFDPRKDTAIIKPYEFYVKTKGYIPYHGETTPVNPSDVRISIRGFENADTIPAAVIFDKFKIVLSDTTFHITQGALVLFRRGVYSKISFSDETLKTCEDPTFRTKKKRYENARPDDILFFWDVKASKDDKIYELQTKAYKLK